MNVKLPNIAEVEARKLLEGSSNYIFPHTAIVIRLDTTICSGTFAKSFGYHGILTAGHCAKLIFEKERVGFAISDKVHQLWVECKSLEHVPIEEIKDHGPDLSFIIIKDAELIALIERESHTFYDLDAVAEIEWLKGSVITTHWCICGSPHEKLDQKLVYFNNQEHVVNTSPSLCMQSRLNKIDAIQDSSDFDYVHLEVLAGYAGYPTDYIGNSGGGIWYQRFDTSDGVNYTVKPILAGVVVWQETKIKEDWKTKIKSRAIIGHYYHSIYFHVRRALKVKKETQQ